MLKRLYVDGYLCLENFDLDLESKSASLILGRNGSGKSTVRLALEILQRIGRGTSRMGDLITRRQLSARERTPVVRFEIEATITGGRFLYTIVAAFKEDSVEPTVLEEHLDAGGTTVFSREGRSMRLHEDALGSETTFSINPNVAALPIVQGRSLNGPLATFREWLGRILILAPVPSQMDGYSDRPNLEPAPSASNIGDWFSELTTQYPASYTDVDRRLREVMPDFSAIRNQGGRGEGRFLSFDFRSDGRTLTVPFDALSDGEKIFFIAAVATAAHKAYGPLLCFWDEPDNFVGLSEVGYLLQGLKKGFREGGQLIVTSHNPEAIRAFTRESALFLYRTSHLEPTRIRKAADVEYSGDLADAIARGDVDL